MDQRWCLGNKKTKSMEKNLYANQLAQRVVQGRSEGATELDWMVWSPGWSAWKPLVDVDELMQEIQIISNIDFSGVPTLDSEMPDFPGATNELADKLPKSEPKIEMEIKPVTIGASKKEDKLTSAAPQSESSPSAKAEIANRRKHPRYTARYRCIIRSSKMTFRTFTIDISLGGVALEDALPQELLGEECQIYIASSKTHKNLKFKISLTGRMVPKYFSFTEASTSQLNELQIWLESENLSLVA